MRQPSLLISSAVCLLALLISTTAHSTKAQGPGQASTEGEQQYADLGHCQLDSGQILEDCRVGYRTFGHLNAAADNAVLMPTWLYGVSADLIPLFGDGSASQHLVDTTRFFGIAIDAFADGVSSSPSNSPHQHATSFPLLNPRDNVRAQYRVMTEVLHLRHLHAVLGLSMGGEQTFVWSTLYPDFFDLAVPILGTPRLTVYDLHLKQIMLASIETDPAYDNGRYTTEPPLKLANSIGTIVVTTAEYRNQQTPPDKFEEFIAATESPLAIDANDRLWQLRTITHQDVIGHQTPEQAARATKAKFLIIVSAQDHLVNPQPALDWAKALNAPTYISQGTCAHLIMTCDAAAVSTRVRKFLATGSLP